MKPVVKHLGCGDTFIFDRYLLVGLRIMDLKEHACKRNEGLHGTWKATGFDLMCYTCNEVSIGSDVDFPSILKES